MSSALAGLVRRYPALLRLRPRRRPRVPFVAQLTTMECGAACLTMVLRLHGRATDLEEVRGVLANDHNAASAAALVRAADRFGLGARAVRVEPGDLRKLPAGSILHWDFVHFVVFQRVVRGGVEIVDPGAGRRRLAWAEVERSLTGIALVLAPSSGFRPQRARNNRWSRVIDLLVQSGLLPRLFTCSVIMQGLGLAVPAVTGLVVDRLVPHADSSLLPLLAVAIGCVVTVHLAGALLRGHLLVHLQTRLSAQMTVGFFDHLIGLAPSFFARRTSGDLLMRLNSHSIVRDVLSNGALSAVLDGLLIISNLCLVLWLNAQLGRVVLAVAVLQVVLLALAGRRQHELMKAQLAAEAGFQGFQVEVLAAIESLKAMGREREAARSWADLFVNSLNVSVTRGRLGAWMGAVQSGLQMGTPLLLLALGTARVLARELTIGEMLALNALAIGALAPLATLVQTALTLQMVGSYVDRHEDVYKQPPEQELRPGRPAVALSGQMALEKVTFRYEGQSEPAVRGVSVEIPAGKMVALVGRSGAGKSTLGHLLLGLLRPSEGRVLVDGHDLLDLDLNAVRRQIGVVTQNVQLFGQTIRSNIAFFDPEVDLGAVMQAARLVQLHDEIVKMPLGYDTLLSDRGLSLSGGQRQRVALARALVRSPAVLLLDEATSALDTVTEAKVQSALAALQCTRIVIAHRLSTMRSADLILVLDEGAVVERGTHDELIARRGAYHELISAQIEPLPARGLHAGVSHE